jgi:hypothetical protein
MRLLFLAALSLAYMPIAAAAQTSPPPTQDSALVEEVRRLIAARVTSDVGGDSAAFHRLIVPGYVHVNDSAVAGPARNGFRLSGNTAPTRRARRTKSRSRGWR